MKETVFVSHYETKKAGVLFPFGHGLSYTTFAYSNLTVDKQELLDTEQAATAAISRFWFSGISIDFRSTPSVS